jgi:carbonic anhydrase
MEKKKIIIGDVTFPEQSWVIDQLGGEYLWFFVDHAVIGNPYGCTIRNVIATIINHSIDEIYVIGSNDKTQRITKEKIEGFYQKEQICSSSRETVEYIFNHSNGGSLSNWLTGLASKEENIKQSVQLLKHHPIIPKRLKVSGYLVVEREKNVKKIV